MITYTIDYCVEMEVETNNEVEDAINEANTHFYADEYEPLLGDLLDLNSEIVENLPIPIINDSDTCKNVEYVDNSFRVQSFYFKK